MTKVITISTIGLKSQSGSTLVEVLIALLVMSIGMLATASMFTESIATLGNLVYQQRAIRLASDISGTLANLPQELLRDPPGPEEGECDSGQVCTPTQWLADNLYNWQQHADDYLPNGTVQVNSFAVHDNAHTEILITWTHKNGQTLNYALQLELG
jgi:prepilin-type N-terminal cleavage/methylation domain-containing protein